MNDYLNSAETASLNSNIKRVSAAPPHLSSYFHMDKNQEHPIKSNRYYNTNQKKNPFRIPQVMSHLSDESQQYLDSHASDGKGVDVFEECLDHLSTI